MTKTVYGPSVPIEYRARCGHTIAAHVRYDMGWERIVVYVERHECANDKIEEFTLQFDAKTRRYTDEL